MINVTSPICQEPGCETNAHFGLPKDKKREYCGTHKKLGMIDVTANICIEPGCTIEATFNLPGKKKRLYCVSHAKPNMISHTNIPCIEPGCGLTANFGSPKDRKRKYCNIHKKEGMISLSANICKFPKCKTEANFNLPGIKPGIYCELHKLFGMIDINANICKFPGCTSRATLNKVGFKPKYCALHKSPGMVLRPTHKCEYAGKCRDLAIYGYYYPQFCELHKPVDMINLVDKECTSCHLHMPLDEFNMCHFCSSFKPVRLQKQKEIYDLLLLHGYKFRYDRMSEGAECTGGKERPDIAIDCGDRMIIIEIDEFQHYSYPIECEIVRMKNIYYSNLGIPTIFIRYNPDAYTVSYRTISTPKEFRHEDLLDAIEWAKDNEMLEYCGSGFKIGDKIYHLLTYYMYYDNYELYSSQVMPIIV
jgi:hypothetical protein